MQMRLLLKMVRSNQVDDLSSVVFGDAYAVH